MARIKLAVVAALTSLAFATSPVSAQEISISTSACEDASVREQRCRSFEVDATIGQIAEIFAPSAFDGVEWIIHVNGWEGVSSDTVIKSGVFVRTV